MNPSNDYESQSLREALLALRTYFEMRIAQRIGGDLSSDEARIRAASFLMVNNTENSQSESENILIKQYINEINTDKLNIDGQQMTGESIYSFIIKPFNPKIRSFIKNVAGRIGLSHWIDRR